ncbi:MAG: carbamate kinase [Chloroflexi bacterium]|nr:carbamate kinase [Chloroflexota bacterium]
MKQIAVVALGGNALLRRGEEPTVARQFRRAAAAMGHVATLAARRWSLVVTHGNGPQVGNILIRVEAALGKAYTLPLSMCVAESQGEIGYVIEQSLHNQLQVRGLKRPVVGLLTQVLVDRRDPAFKDPTKPIGPFYSGRQAALLRRKGFHLAQVDKAAWRRVVPSPQPLGIVEADTVRTLLRQGVIVIAAGGGGIPVTQEDGRLKGVDAVIDKDLASACLAKSIGAELLLILTDVPRVALNFGTNKQQDIPLMTATEARRYTAEGHFPPGSMGPKVAAAIDFVEHGGEKAIITCPERLLAALKGRQGTHITL